MTDLDQATANISTLSLSPELAPDLAPKLAPALASKHNEQAVCAPAPILVFGVGNPSRGDDALGPRLIERLQALQADGRLSEVDLLTDFQLQVEHTLDLCGRERVIIVDAAIDLEEAFRLTPVEPASGVSWTTHSLSPAALASLFGSLFGTPPRLEQLAIGATAFGLGDDLSALAAANLEPAVARLIEELEPLLSAIADTRQPVLG